MATATAPPNKTQCVYKALKALGLDASRSEVQKWILKEIGFEMDVDTISTYMPTQRAKIAKETGGPVKTKRVRNKTAAKTAAKSQPAALAQPTRPGQPTQKTQTPFAPGLIAVKDMATLGDLRSRYPTEVLKNSLDVFALARV